MLTASMSKAAPSLKLALMLGFLLALLPVNCAAKAFRPLQIMLPGNFAGHLLTVDRDLKLVPELCWRVVATVKAFAGLKDHDRVIIAPGNNSSIYSPINCLFAGAIERELIDRCSPQTRALAPGDLEMFAASGPSKEIRQQVWTNHSTFDRQTIFAPFTCIKQDGQRIWHFNFIGKEFCHHLPLQRWGNLEVDTARTSLRRLAPDLSAGDLSISTVYLCEAEIEQLADELRQLPGWHLIVQVATDAQPPLFSTRMVEHKNNLWFLSLADGHTHLPLINVYRRNHGWPRFTLRRPPFSKVSGSGAEALFEQQRAKIKQALTKPLRVISPATQASVSAFAFSNVAHARLIKQALSSDITFLHAPKMQHLVDNVICTGHIFSAMANERLHNFRLSGTELTALATALIKDSATTPVTVAGAEIRWFAGRIGSLQIAGQPCLADKHYLVSTTESTLQDSALRQLPFYDKLSGYEGITLWQAWISRFKSLLLSDQQLIE